MPVVLVTALFEDKREKLLVESIILSHLVDG